MGIAKGLLRGLVYGILNHPKGGADGMEGIVPEDEAEGGGTGEQGKKGGMPHGWKIKHVLDDRRKKGSRKQTVADADAGNGGFGRRDNAVADAGGDQQIIALLDALGGGIGMVGSPSFHHIGDLIKIMGVDGKRACLSRYHGTVSPGILNKIGCLIYETGLIYQHGITSFKSHAAESCFRFEGLFT